MKIKQTVQRLLTESPQGLSAREIIVQVCKMLPGTEKKNVYQSLAYELRKDNPRWERLSKGFYRIR